jgi:hypothetical protein
MIKSILLIVILCISLPTVVCAEDFLGAPVMPGGKTLVSKSDRLETIYDMKYDEVVNFYRKALKSEQYVKFWDRGDAMYIEEHLDRPWHSITISSTDKGQTTIVILKDNWTWIIGTLMLRFIGTFAVLTALYIALSISGTILSRTIKPSRAKT